ncbi:MAG: DNA repair protein RecO, partial [Pseudomonadota bacterium]|nr:DNA repair protein RecO [Pseudomonadota bacterium]
VRACVEYLPQLKTQLRALLHYHCDVKVLKTRQMMIDLQAF